MFYIEISESQTYCVYTSRDRVQQGENSIFS